MLLRLVTIRTQCYTVVTAYVHVFMAYLKFINREFLWDPLSLLLILRLMQFLVILREFCRLLLGILITLSKIPANLRISQEIKLLTLVKNQYLSTLFRSSLKSQLVTENGNGRRGTKGLSHFTSGNDMLMMLFLRYPEMNRSASYRRLSNLPFSVKRIDICPFLI